MNEKGERKYYFVSSHERVKHKYTPDALSPVRPPRFFELGAKTPPLRTSSGYRLYHQEYLVLHLGRMGGYRGGRLRGEMMTFGEGHTLVIVTYMR